jgi:hypothetical protein
MEALAKKFQGQVRFVFVYCQEHHPDREFTPHPSMYAKIIPALKQTANRAEREERAREFRRQMKGSVRRILIDEDDDSGYSKVQVAYNAQLGARVIVVDTRGQIVRRDGSVPDLEKHLHELLADVSR